MIFKNKKWKKFIITRPALQRILNERLHIQKEEWKHPQGQRTKWGLSEQLIKIKSENKTQNRQYDTIDKFW